MPSRTNPSRPPSSGGPSIAEEGNGAEILARLMAEAGHVHDLDVVIYGKRLTFKYRRIQWVERNQIAAESWVDEERKDAKGNVQLFKKYSAEAFVNECFRRMFMTADLARLQPFPLSPAAIKVLPPEVGVQFEKVLPRDDAAAEVEAVDDLKKESAASSAESS